MPLLALVGSVGGTIYGWLYHSTTLDVHTATVWLVVVGLWGLTARLSDSHGSLPGIGGLVCVICWGCASVVYITYDLSSLMAMVVR